MFSAQTVSAQVFINEIQILPINERFIELYNSDNSDVDLTGWYIQRKTATGSSFGSLVSSTQLNGKTIKSHGYFLISRNLYGNSDVTTDLTLTESNTIRIRDSKGKDVDQIEWGGIDIGKSRQRISAGEWVTASPTPGTTNEISQNINTTAGENTATASTPTVPQVTAQAGPQTRVVLAGAPILFEGKIAGLENNSAGVTRTMWSFGDGASGEGESVSHTYYYPGEYTAVLDVVSGGLTATDKMLVRVVLPDLSLSAGGDASRSFFTIQNHGGDELDVSGWQVSSGGKTFTFPKNTILGARKSVIFASEVTGLATPAGSIPELLFPNGSRVATKNEAKTEPAVPMAYVSNKAQIPVAKSVARVSAVSQVQEQQEASTINAFPEAQTPLRAQKGDGLWSWYAGTAFLGALALLGLRLARQESVGGIMATTTPTADDFEIVEDEDDNDDKKASLF